MQRRRADDHVREAWRKAQRLVRQPAGETGKLQIEREHAIAVEMSDRLNPSSKVARLLRCALAAQFCNSILYLRDGDRGQE